MIVFELHHSVFAVFVMLVIFLVMLVMFVMLFQNLRWLGALGRRMEAVRLGGSHSM